MYEWIYFFEEFNYPTIWWIHEGDEYFEMVKNKLPSKLNDNILVLTVGIRPLRALGKYGFHYNPKILMYGTEDLALKNDIGYRTSCEELNVMIIGAICKRKNQINTIKTILSFPEEVRKKFHFLVVGTPLGGENHYFEEFMALIKNNSLFEYLGYVERKDIPKLYRKVDAVLACSIDDPLPVVVTESLMFGKISIVSSEVGQYPYIINGSNGFKYNVFDTNELEDVLIASYENKRNSSIAENSRATFKKYFSMETFAVNLLSYTQELMEKL
jgi:glycosyltransferase involved in cell wall biosynthesis